MAKTIAFVHHKGGTGKTTSCLSVAGHLAEAGKKVLVVDLDPQGNATSGLRVEKDSLKYSMYNVMVAGSPMDKVIKQTDFDNLDVAPSSFELAWTELSGKSINLFSQSLGDIKSLYDYILIDTPPSLGRLMVSGIFAADHVITTLDVGVFALDGLESMKKVFESVEEGTKKEINNSMIILTKAKKSSPVSKILKMRNHSDEIIKSLKGKHKKNIFLVPNDKNIYDSQLHGEPISHYSPSSKASLSYKKIANEIMKWD